MTLKKFRELVKKIDDLEQELRESGMFITMHAVNRAKRISGYEFAGDMKGIEETSNR